MRGVVPIFHHPDFDRDGGEKCGPTDSHGNLNIVGIISYSEIKIRAVVFEHQKNAVSSRGVIGVTKLPLVIGARRIPIVDSESVGR